VSMTFRDRVGLLGFDAAVRAEVRPARGAAQTRKVIDTAVALARTSDGETSLSAAIDGLAAHARQRAVAMLFSDFRSTAGWGQSRGRAAAPPIRTPLQRLGRLHETVCVVLHDPREESLPRAGRVRVEDHEAPGRTLLLDTGSARTRARYRRAWALRAARLERALRASGSDVVWMRTDRDPLGTLLHFFNARATHGRAKGARSAA